jgi:hypothetical protein
VPTTAVRCSPIPEGSGYTWSAWFTDHDHPRTDSGTRTANWLFASRRTVRAHHTPVTLGGLPGFRARGIETQVILTAVCTTAALPLGSLSGDPLSGAYTVQDARTRHRLTRGEHRTVSRDEVTL